MAEETTNSEVQSESKSSSTNTSEKGSNPVLMILIIGLLVVGGFYFYNQMSKSDAPANDEEMTEDSDDSNEEESLPEDVVVETETMEMESEATPVENSIVDVATTAGTFETLLTALRAAGLDGTLSSEGEYTVFAPSDEAFDKLPVETLQGLLADPQALADVLKYHVVSGEMKAEDLTSGSEVPTLQGGALMVTVNPDGTVTVNGAKVVRADVDAENGVIHVVDTVLIPENN